MTPSPALTRLSLLVAVLAAASATGGLLWPGGDGPFTITTLAGTTVELHGLGLYRHDGRLAASTYLGTDAVTLLGMVPLLLGSLLVARRGSARAALVLTAALGFFLYNAVHLAFAVAYNPLYPAYVVLLGASLFAFVAAFAGLDLRELAKRTGPDAPRRGPAAFLAFAGIVLALVWLSDLLPAVLAGGTPAGLGASTTLVTYAVDLAVIVPATLVAANRLLRRDPLGTALGVVLLVVNAIVGVVVAAQTAAALIIGVPMPPEVVAVFVAPFLVLATAATWFAARLVLAIREPA